MFMKLEHQKKIEYMFMYLIVASDIDIEDNIRTNLEQLKVWIQSA